MVCASSWSCLHLPHEECLVGNDYRVHADSIGDDLHYIEMSPVGDPLTFPTVFVLHGWGSCKERHLTTLYRYASEGFRAIVFDLRRHGVRQGFESRERDFERDPVATFFEIVTESLSDLSLLFDEFELPAAGVHGGSLGGIILFEALCVEPRITVGVSLMGSPNRGLLARGFGLSERDPEIKRFFDGSPHYRAAALYPPKALLMLHGARDTVVSPLGVIELHKILLAPYLSFPERVSLKIYPDTGHEATEEMLQEASFWFKKFREDLLILTPKGV